MLVSAVEPVAQMRRGFVGCLTIERHHSRRHARNPRDMGSPAFLGYPRHFNDERTSGYDFFKAMLHDDTADKSTG